MTPRRHVLIALLSLGLALVVQALLARFVGGRDVLGAVLAKLDLSLLLSLAVLLATRLFLLLLAPGWLLYVAARAWLERGR